MPTKRNSTRRVTVEPKWAPAPELQFPDDVERLADAIEKSALQVVAATDKQTEALERIAKALEDGVFSVVVGRA